MASSSTASTSAEIERHPCYTYPIKLPNGDIWRLDPESPLNRLYHKRMSEGRDLKIIITARNAETGTGKTTAGGALGLSWNPWWNYEQQGALKVSKYLKQYNRLDPRSVLIMDEAEQIDARRSMSHKNVDFSHKWMMMRVRQVCSILTLPSPNALDSRMEELADVRINVLRRGLARVYDIRVDDHSRGNRGIRQFKAHDLEFPDVSNHPELEKLAEAKNERIDEMINKTEQEEKKADPKAIKNSIRKEIAQNCREAGDTLREAEKRVGMSRTWIGNKTETPEN